MLLQEGAYPYEYKDDWEKFNETSFLKKIFTVTVNAEDINDADCAHAKRVCKDFEIWNLGKYCDCIFKLIHYC